MEKKVEIDIRRFDALHTKAEPAILNGEPVLRVYKSDKIMQFDENTYARLKGEKFHNGTIEVDMLSRLLPDAPDFARGFIGIVYRVNESDSEFESFYVRPANGRGCTDPVRRAHGCQYFSYPGYTFSYFREFGITEYEAPVDIGLDEWIHLKAVIEDARAAFYVNDIHVLTVDGMKHGTGQQGAVGFYVDTGTDGFFKNLKITAAD